MEKRCKKCPIEISISSYKLIFVFIFPIIDIFQNKIRQKYVKTNTEYFKTLSYYLSYLFSSIFLILKKILYPNEKIQVKEDEEEEEIEEEKKEEDKKEDEKKEGNKIDESDDSEINISKNKVNKTLGSNILKEMKKKKWRKYVFIFIILLICASSLAYNHFEYESYLDKRTIGMAWKIPEFFLFSYFILHYKYYRHHFITFGLNVATLITKYIITTTQSNFTDKIGYHLWFYLLFATTYCLIFIFGKYCMHIFYRSPYFIMLIVGIIMSLILVILSTIKYLISGGSQIFSGFVDNIIDVKTFFLFLADIVLQFIFNLGMWITTYYFTPCHTIIAENVMEIEYYLYDYSDNSDYWSNQKFYLNFWVFPIFHIINFICSLIFNEIIILNFCKLDYYTNIRIQEREKLDSIYLLSLKQKAEDDEKILQTENED